MNDYILCRIGVKDSDGVQLIDEDNSIIGYLHQNELSVKEPEYLPLTDSFISTLEENDVVKMNRDGIKLLLKNDSSENILVLTNQCNNNCIYCPDPESIRKREYNNNLRYFQGLVSLIDPNLQSLCITGGEPTLLRNDLIELLKLCKSRLTKTEFLLLTNGRLFSYPDYTRAFAVNGPPRLVIGIPFHSAKAKLHDYITRVKGSFDQTFYGLKNLISLGQKVEIRVVINKLNYKDLTNIAVLIINEFPKVYRVNFMAELKHDIFH